MKFKNLLLTLGLLISFQINSLAQEKKDFLSIGEKIKFENKTYNLEWSSNPTPTYFKQEYIQTGETVEKYNEMIIIEAVNGNIEINQAAGMKIREIKNLKKTNPIVNYQVFNNKDKSEITIDFMLSDNSRGIFEWNVYRYQKQENKSGNNLVLYVYSYRNYVSSREEIMGFFTNVKSMRINKINSVNEANIPKITIAN
ncbi:hypothetical protein AXE80_07255 [Wenyingzhuangia fucanilytica]|uniref:Uncharacterized protein n=1 Tax=Wenyingzhuangia fucanilytica TaxID=1790137 RepID=A0A1B1Y5R6_9FLAO|nr:hypothetical protein [Wenyingzhuangia fucanilytica]ANW96087.1 hypothetical protein AXE80_07255 [Wenyingzhuangia fucanilytica]